MLRQLRTGGGMVSSAAAAAAAQAMMVGECQSRGGNLRLLRHLSADGSPSSPSPGGSSSSSSVAEDPRWKSPLFDALLSLAARASIPSSSSSSPTAPTPTSTSSSKTSTPPPLPPPLRSVAAERHGLFDFLIDGARTAQAHVLAKFIRSNVETAFDEREFLEGAADARHAVFDALSDEGDLAPLRGAVAPGLLRALHGLKEMHAAAGLAVRMTATEDGGGGGGGAGGDGPSAPCRAELGVMGLLDPPLFEAMADAFPGFEDLPSISRELEERLAAAGSSDASGGEGSDEGGGGSSSSGSSGGSSSSSGGAASSGDAAAGTAAAPATPKSKLALSALDLSSFANAVEAAKSKSGVFSGRYQVLAVRFTGGVLVQTFAKSISGSFSAKKEEAREEAAGVAAAASSSKAAAAAAASSSKAAAAAASSSSPPPPPPPPASSPAPEAPQSSKTTTTLTLVRELLDKRPHSWRFVRGPLPEGLPVRQLGLPWTLLSIDLD